MANISTSEIANLNRYQYVDDDSSVVWLEKAQSGKVSMEDITDALAEFTKLFKAGMASKAEILTLARAFPDTPGYTEAAQRQSEQDDDHEPLVIGGPASISLVDREGHLITTGALKRAFQKFMANDRTRNVMVLHSDVQVGWALPAYISKGGQIFKSGVNDKGLFFICEIRDDTSIAHKVADQIKKGMLKSYSIAGSATKVQNMTKGLTPYLQVDDMELAEVTVCEKGVNQGASFEILKAEMPSMPKPPQIIAPIRKMTMYSHEDGTINFTKSFTEWLVKEKDPLTSKESFVTLNNEAGRQAEHAQLLREYGFPSAQPIESMRYVPVVETETDDDGIPVHNLPPWVVNEAGEALGDRLDEDSPGYKKSDKAKARQKAGTAQKMFMDFMEKDMPKGKPQLPGGRKNYNLNPKGKRGSKGAASTILRPYMQPKVEPKPEEETIEALVEKLMTSPGAVSGGGGQFGGTDRTAGSVGFGNPAKGVKRTTGGGAGQTEWDIEKAPWDRFVRGGRDKPERPPLGRRVGEAWRSLAENPSNYEDPETGRMRGLRPGDAPRSKLESDHLARAANPPRSDIPGRGRPVRPDPTPSGTQPDRNRRIAEEARAARTGGRPEAPPSPTGPSQGPNIDVKGTAARRPGAIARGQARDAPPATSTHPLRDPTTGGDFPDRLQRMADKTQRGRRGPGFMSRVFPGRLGDAVRGGAARAKSAVENRPSMREAGGTLSRLGRQFGTSVKEGAKFGSDAYSQTGGSIKRGVQRGAESIGQGARESWAGLTGKTKGVGYRTDPETKERTRGGLAYSAGKGARGLGQGIKEGYTGARGTHGKPSMARQVGRLFGQGGRTGARAAAGAARGAIGAEEGGQDTASRAGYRGGQIAQGAIDRAARGVAGGVRGLMPGQVGRTLREEGSDLGRAGAAGQAVGGGLRAAGRFAATYAPGGTKTDEWIEGRRTKSREAKQDRADLAGAHRDMGWAEGRTVSHPANRGMSHADQRGKTNEMLSAGRGEKSLGDWMGMHEHLLRHNETGEKIAHMSFTPPKGMDKNTPMDAHRFAQIAHPDAGHIRYSGAGQYQGHSGIHAHVNNVLQGMTDASSMPNHIEPQAGGLDSRTSQPNVPRMIPNPAHPENAGGGVPAPVTGPQNFGGPGSPAAGPTPGQEAGPWSGIGKPGYDKVGVKPMAMSLDKMLHKAFRSKPRRYSKTWGM